MKHAIPFLVATFSFPALVNSCSTARGFGQDLQKVGNRLENQAESTGGTAPEPATRTYSTTTTTYTTPPPVYTPPPVSTTPPGY